MSHPTTISLTFDNFNFNFMPLSIFYWAEELKCYCFENPVISINAKQTEPWIVKFCNGTERLSIVDWGNCAESIWNIWILIIFFYTVYKTFEILNTYLLIQDTLYWTKIWFRKTQQLPILFRMGNLLWSIFHICHRV